MWIAVLVRIEEDVQAHLLIEVDGNYPDVLMQEMEGIAGVVTEFDCGEILSLQKTISRKKNYGNYAAECERVKAILSTKVGRRKGAGVWGQARARVCVCVCVWAGGCARVRARARVCARAGGGRRYRAGPWAELP